MFNYKHIGTYKNVYVVSGHLGTSVFKGSFSDFFLNMQMYFRWNTFSFLYTMYISSTPFFIRAIRKEVTVYFNLSLRWIEFLLINTLPGTSNLCVCECCAYFKSIAYQHVKTSFKIQMQFVLSHIGRTILKLYLFQTKLNQGLKLNFWNGKTAYILKSFISVVKCSFLANCDIGGILKTHKARQNILFWSFKHLLPQTTGIFKNLTRILWIITGIMLQFFFPYFCVKVGIFPN